MSGGAWNCPTHHSECRRRRRDGRDVTFRTARGSKGLEADYIVIPSMATRVLASRAPSPTTGSSVSPYRRHRTSITPKERRLFHVALTRARRHVVLLPQHRMSPVVVELSTPHASPSRVAGSLSRFAPIVGRRRLRSGEDGTARSFAARPSLLADSRETLHRGPRRAALPTVRARFARGAQRPKEPVPRVHELSGVHVHPRYVGRL